MMKKKSLQWSALRTDTSVNFPRESSLCPCEWQCHHDVNRHVSLRAAAPAFCVNYTGFHLYESSASLCVNDQRWRDWRTATVVLMRLIGLDLDWKLCCDSALSRDLIRLIVTALVTTDVYKPLQIVNKYMVIDKWFLKAFHCLLTVK